MKYMHACKSNKIPYKESAIVPKSQPKNHMKKSKLNLKNHNCNDDFYHILLLVITINSIWKTW